MSAVAEHGERALSILEELVALKHHKDLGFRAGLSESDYQTRKDRAWTEAFLLVSEAWRDRSRAEGHG